MELKRVMLVDDDENIRRVAELTLTKLAKFDAYIAKSGMEALEAIPNFQPDLIILDVMMPKMDGPTVFAELKKNPATASIAVVFMTAKIQKHEVEAYTALGANAVISKPFEPSELGLQLRKIYAQSQLATAR